MPARLDGQNLPAGYDKRKRKTHQARILSQSAVVSTNGLSSAGRSSLWLKAAACKSRTMPDQRSRRPCCDGITRRRRARVYRSRTSLRHQRSRPKQDRPSAFSFVVQLRGSPCQWIKNFLRTPGACSDQQKMVRGGRLSSAWPASSRSRPHDITGLRWFQCHREMRAPHLRRRRRLPLRIPMLTQDGAKLRAVADRFPGIS